MRIENYPGAAAKSQFSNLNSQILVLLAELWPQGIVDGPLPVAVAEGEGGIAVEDVLQHGGIVAQGDGFVVAGSGGGDVDKEEDAGRPGHTDTLVATECPDHVGGVDMPAVANPGIGEREIHLDDGGHAAAIVVVGVDNPPGCGEVVGRDAGIVGCVGDGDVLLLAARDDKPHEGNHDDYALFHFFISLRVVTVPL